jgi:hypothetical protein
MFYTESGTNSVLRITPHSIAGITHVPSKKRTSIASSKEGLYDQQLSLDEKSRLGNMPLEDLRQDIGVLRVFAARLLSLTPEAGDIDGFAKIAQSLARIYTAINASLRTQIILTAGASAWDDLMAGALAEEPFHISAEEAALREQTLDEDLDEASALWKKVFAFDPQPAARQRPFRPRR